MKCKRESDGRKLDHHSLETMRMQAVKAVQSGQKVTSVAAAFGLNIRTVFSWLAAYSSGGQKALQAKSIPGRPPKVTAEELRWIAQTVKDNTPQQLKFEYGLWTLSLIGELIRRQFGKTLSLSAVGRVMRILGFTPQKPLYQAWQQDAVLVQKWQTETYPAIQAEARQVGATIYFADESGIRSDYHTGTTWAPCGETPVVNVTGSRFSLNMLSAVGTRGEFRFMLHEGTVNASVFKDFLKRLMLGATQPVFVVVDGHPTHKAKLVTEYVNSLQGRLKLFYLPPYSPQLNPDEQVWAHVKRQVAKRFVQDKDSMKRLVLGALRRIQRLPALLRSFFQQPECRYAEI